MRSSESPSAEAAVTAMRLGALIGTPLAVGEFLEIAQ